MQTILTVNGGSSSLKCTLFQVNGGQEHALYQFKLGNILGQPRVAVKDAAGQRLAAESPDFANIPAELRHEAALNWVLNWLQQQAPDYPLSAFGHRVVHGGDTFNQPVVVSDSVLDTLATLNPLAPLHQPYNLCLINACQKLAPDLPQVACFDTMFHTSQPDLERHYALPRRLTDAGVKRYGFHGLSYEFIQRSLSRISSAAGQAKTVVCHLGAGASMCAINHGKSIASSMGFTAVDGLPMGSRCGNIDPGVLLYLQRQYTMDSNALERLIYKESGWLGVSGVSADMLTLHQSDNPHAEQAIAMFAYRIALELGRLSAALQGLEQVVFTGGVGENDADLRQRVLQQSRWLGIHLDPEANAAGADIISLADSPVTVRVIATNEEAMIARHVIEQLYH